MYDAVIFDNEEQKLIFEFTAFPTIPPTENEPEFAFVNEAVHVFSTAQFVIFDPSAYEAIKPK